MKLPTPLSSPSTTLKIVASLLVLPVIALSNYTAEALASSFRQIRVTFSHRVIAPLSFALNALSAVLLLRLFAPLAGFSPLAPPTVALIFGFFILDAWLNILKKGLSTFANIDGTQRPPTTIVGPSASQLLKDDPRPPILYLRSFTKELETATYLGRFAYIRSRRRGVYFFARRPRASDDLFTMLRASLAREYKRKLLNSKRSAHDEQLIFSEYFSELGPYIAVGRPGESAKNMDLGSAKDYIPDETWRARVSELIDMSAAILIEAAQSEGLVWEFREVLSRATPEKVLLILPRNNPDYRDFRNFAGGIFPYPLPEILPNTRLLMFGRDWSPIPLENMSITLEDSVRPFVDRIWITEPQNAQIDT